MKKDETRRGSAASGREEGGAIALVSALMAERRRYEGWIAALEAKRTGAPDHVFTRVHADYMARLDAVLVQLTTHADDLRREMEALESRRDALTADHRKAEDERAEAELRAHVGELTAEDWQALATVSDAALAALAARRSDVDQELVRTLELLDSTTRPEAAQADEPAELPSASQQPAAAPPQSPRVSRAAAVVVIEKGAHAVDSAAELPAELPASVIAAEQQLLDIDERSARVSRAAESAPHADAPTEPAAPHAPRKTQGFDELAFLSSVVDTPSGAFDAAPADLPDETARRDIFARRSREDAVVHLDGDTPPLGAGAIEQEGEPLLSGTVGHSALGRDSIVADASKSLKCGECGALNYPTEWYCERCGAELASL